MNNLLVRLGQNWKAGVTVSLVSIPLSVSLAVASHATPVMGIVTAVYAGLVAAMFGGSNYNIVGPTGALSGLIATFALANGVALIPTLTILAGIIMFLAFILRLEKYLVFVPGSAIHGFTLGVAFIIGLNQLNFALGLSGLRSHEKFVQNVLESLMHVGAASPVSVTIFSIGLILLFLFKKYIPRVPGAIFVAPVGIIFGILAADNVIPLSIRTLGDIYPTMSFSFFLPYRFTPTLGMVVPALAIALVAILETMLSAKIADGMTKTKYHKKNEMRGLALANMASGLMGGIPATAALARTSLNVKTGANDRASAMVSSICIAAISLFLLAYFKFIPLAVIAAILVYVAINMVEVSHFKRMFEYDKKNFVVAFFVAGITLFEDPIIGILFGVGVSSLLLLEKISRGQFDLVLNSNKKMTGRANAETFEKLTANSDTIVYSFKGLLCYINSEAHIERFHLSLSEARHVILRFRSVHYIDMDGVEALDEIVRLIQSQGKDVYFTSLNPIVEEMLKESHFYKELCKKKRVFVRSSEALSKLGFKLHS